MRILLFILLLIIVLIAGSVFSVISYLSPEELPPRIPAPSSVRTISAGDIIGIQRGRIHMHGWVFPMRNRRSMIFAGKRPDLRVLGLLVVKRLSLEASVLSYRFKQLRQIYPLAVRTVYLSTYGHPVTILTSCRRAMIAGR